MLVVILGANVKGRLQGGKKSARDRWYGLDAKSDFDGFRRWWHREGKAKAGGADLAGKDDAEGAYSDWVDQGRPKAN